MKLQSLRLRNFRQFEESTPRIEFAHQGQRNVTLIHGSNGSGKTTLLNALTWALYGNFTAAFAQPEQLINRKVLREATPGTNVECRVELQFEHNDRRYRLERVQIVRKEGSGEQYSLQREFVSLQSAGADGGWVDVREADIPDTINRILPPQLHSYFFFDGERIERLQRPENRTEAIKSTTMLTGELVLTRAIDDLDRARKSIEGELKEIGDAETQELFQRKGKLETEQAQLEGKKGQHEQNLAGFVSQKAAVDERLRELESARALQQRRDDFLRQEQSAKQDLGLSRGALAEIVSNNGYRAFMRDAVASFRDVIADLRTAGELPTAIKTPFVQQLLTQEECICGRELKPGEPAHTRVKGWLERGGLSDIEDTAIRMEAQIGVVERETDDLFSRLTNEQAQRSRHRQRLAQVEEELLRIRDALKGSSEENVRDLELRRERLDEQILEAMMDQERDRRRLEELQGQINDLDKEIEKRQARTAQQLLTQRRLQACREAKQALEEVRKRQRQVSREDLAERINKFFSTMSFTDYQAKLEENYALALVDRLSGQPVGSSTGENQVLSLSFIGAVIDQARENAARRDGLPGRSTRCTGGRWRPTCPDWLAS
jgi:DNA sulfur modification protein DndD